VQFTSRAYSPRVLIRRHAGRPCCPPLLKTFAAKYRAPLRGFERNGGFLAALRANSFGLDPLHISRGRTCAHALSAVPFACLAPFGFVLKTLVGKKHLLAGCEYEFRRAIRALQNLIAVFHMPLQAGKERQRGSSGQTIVGIRSGLLRFPPTGWHETAGMDPGNLA